MHRTKFRWVRTGNAMFIRTEVFQYSCVRNNRERPVIKPHLASRAHTLVPILPPRRPRTERSSACEPTAARARFRSPGKSGDRSSHPRRGQRGVKIKKAVAFTMTHSRKKKSYVVCLSNDGYAASLEPRKIYVALRAAAAERNGLLRGVDESGEDYLYSRERLRP